MQSQWWWSRRQRLAFEFVNDFVHNCFPAPHQAVQVVGSDGVRILSLLFPDDMVLLASMRNNQAEVGQFVAADMRITT